jgi:ABC-type glutathione transport system ATPase component
MERETEIMTEIESRTEVSVTPVVRGPIAMQLRNVAVAFHGRTAVRDCSFDVEKNKVTSLIGPSGSGRTDSAGGHRHLSGQPHGH